MTCNEAAEFVSALCDGERIPAAAAAHMGDCEDCQTRLREYITLGAEMRREASLEMERESRAMGWEVKRRSISTLWQKGWETMRIPRLVFGALVIALIAMGSGWTLSKVKAHASGDVVLLHVERGDEKKSDFTAALSLVDKKYDRCATMWGDFSDPSRRIMYGYQIQILGREDNRVRLGVKAMSFPAVQNNQGFGATMSIDALDHSPQKEVLFTPGEASKVEIPGFPALTLHGEWTDHLPPPMSLNPNNSKLDPGPMELRIQSPVLLRDKKLVGDWEGGGASVDQADQGVDFAMKDVGRFIFALHPLQGGIKGRIQGSRITFQSKGHSYTLLSAVYVARGEDIWVLYDPKYKLEGDGTVMNGATSVSDLLVPATAAN